MTVDGDSVVSRLLADPPVVHELDPEGTMGVWATDESCYRFLARRCAVGSRTLETGAGISTVLFAALGAEHVCVSPIEAEAERIRADCRDRGIVDDRLTFVVERSDEALPRLGLTGLDLAFIDGNHGFPVAMVDFHYAARGFRDCGALVLDDLQLPTVALIANYLDLDPSWRRLERSEKWGAWERAGDWPIGVDRWQQPFLSIAWLPGADSFVNELMRVTRRAFAGAWRRARACCAARPSCRHRPRTPTRCCMHSRPTPGAARAEQPRWPRRAGRSGLAPSPEA